MEASSIATAAIPEDALAWLSIWAAVRTHFSITPSPERFVRAADATP